MGFISWWCVSEYTSRQLAELNLTKLNLSKALKPGYLSTSRNWFDVFEGKTKGFLYFKNRIQNEKLFVLHCCFIVSPTGASWVGHFMSCLLKLLSPELYHISLYSAFFLQHLGISLVYWLNLFKTHCVLFASTCTARQGLSYIPLFTAFWVGARAKDTCDLCVFQNSPLTQCAQRRRTYTSE